MIIFINILLSVIFITFGYLFVCQYFNEAGKDILNAEIFRLNKNRVIYLGVNIISSIFLIFLFEMVYAMSEIQQIKLLSLVLLIFPMAAIDLEVHKIPNKLIIIALGLRVVIYMIEWIMDKASAVITIKVDLLGAGIIGTFFLVLLLVFKNSIGMGDVKLFTVMGLYQGLSGVINSVFYSLVVSFIVAVILLMSKKKKRTDNIPFGPSILVGTIVAISLTGM